MSEKGIHIHKFHDGNEAVGVAITTAEFNDRNSCIQAGKEWVKDYPRLKKHQCSAKGKATKKEADNGND